MATGTTEQTGSGTDVPVPEPARNPTEFLSDLQAFVRRLHASLDPRKIAAISANDGRQQLECDRVSVVLRRGVRVEVASVSGQDRVNPRANQIRKLADLAGAAMQYREPFVFSGYDADLPPSLMQPLADYILESGARWVMIVPLRPAPLPARDTRSTHAVQTPPFGALVIEQFHDAATNQELVERAGLIAEQVEIALLNGLSHQQVLFLPLRQLLGRQLDWLRGRRTFQLLLAVASLTLVISALLVIPADYRVEGHGRMMPVIRREVFAPRNGEVVEVHVTNGERVEVGTRLLQLRNDDLHAQLLAARNRLGEKQQLHQSLRAEFDEASRSGSRNESIRLRGKLAQIRSDLNGELEQLRMLDEQAELLTLRAPIAGTVTTFQPQQLLMNRPVQRGEALLEVMDETGPWRLELNVPEYRMGHLLAAQQQSRMPLAVEFVLSACPERRQAGTLEQIATRAVVSAREGSIVEVYATPLDQPATDAKTGPTDDGRTSSPSPAPNPAASGRRIGAEVQAKLQCGRRSLAYVLFGDLLEFLQKQLWF